MKPRTTRLPDWAVWFACVLPLLGFWTYGLFDLDEGFYGAVVRDMIHRHDWITPTLAGKPWFEKPILAYWLAIPSVQMFGDWVGPRLPSVLCTIATVAVIFRFVRKHSSAEVARLACLVYATNLLVVAIGRMMMTDAPLVLSLTLALTTLADVAFSHKPGSNVGAWCLIGLFVGLGVLAKGPVALILFGGIFIFSSFSVPAFKGIWKSAWPLGLLVCGVVVAMWYVPCYRANGQTFIKEFLIDQNFGRFAGGDKAHTLPSWAAWANPFYYVAILAASLLPWVCFSGFSLVKNAWIKSKGDEPDDVKPNTLSKFLWIWFLVPLVFFTISGTKLPHYILPAVAPIAILVAVQLLKRRPTWRWESIGLAWSACVLVTVHYVMVTDWTNRMKEVQVAADFLNTRLFPVYVYKLGGSGDNSFSFELRDSSHPSFLFYFHGKVFVTDKSSDFAENRNPYFVFTTREVAEHDPALRQFAPTVMRIDGVPFRVNQYVLDYPGSKKYVIVAHVQQAWY